MFKKILANLPFSPGLAGQLQSYRLRLRSEVRLRALGFGLLSLALMIQLMAVNYVPQRLVQEVPANCLYSTDCVTGTASHSGLTTLVLALSVVISGYLYIRSRLMSRELEGLHHQYRQEGGL